MKYLKRAAALVLSVLLLTGPMQVFATEEESRAGKMPFTDVLPTAWYCAEVSYAYSVGLVSGMSSTEFMPARNVTRGQFLTMLGRMLMPAGYQPSGETPAQRLAGFAAASASLSWKCHHSLVSPPKPAPSI